MLSLDTHPIEILTAMKNENNEGIYPDIHYFQATTFSFTSVGIYTLRFDAFLA